ncbi:hypothetical protein M422DRAFT_273729 [Sphaerobolus stellatus SS14]|uniref:Uncharacterized protein n=1 Tax=Sphaerobolus stellatus (strain SS14) TaxID=990650 RepID=A0A0C9UIU2_SPHS4|nr:hypothetical protein M422DRAFT_273729 [Sphaerobolus stellatus SS14]
MPVARRGSSASSTDVQRFGDSGPIIGVDFDRGSFCNPSSYFRRITNSAVTTSFAVSQHAIAPSRLVKDRGHSSARHVYPTPPTNVLPDLEHAQNSIASRSTYILSPAALNNMWRYPHTSPFSRTSNAPAFLPAPFTNRSYARTRIYPKYPALQTQSVNPTCGITSKPTNDEDYLPSSSLCKKSRIQ